ncbi:site-specific integrase [Microbacterium telephonicum]
MTTRQGYAADLRTFLNFLEEGRSGTAWSDATAQDHLAYMAWRREDPEGARISDASWNREVAAVDRFYRWQLSQGNVRENPIPQRRRRPGRRRAKEEGTQPSTYAPGARRSDVHWLPPRSYRLWRDVGLRGYTPSGLPDPTFRGRWADRNALFADAMVRTGMRLTEQASLTTLELPSLHTLAGYHRFWLPKAIAKWGSARYVYLPSPILRDIHSYVETDREQIVSRARARGKYDPSDPSRVVIREPFGSSRQRRMVANLRPEERTRALIRGPSGWEPAIVWLGEGGSPLVRKSWQGVFGDANDRCHRAKLEVSAHAHLLRHTYAVTTLELLSRGYFQSLGHLNSAQRMHYRMVWGEPIRWVQARLGHRSQETTNLYLHALERLEMETRIALIDEAWDDALKLFAHLQDSDAPPDGEEF